MRGHQPEPGRASRSARCIRPSLRSPMPVLPEAHQERRREAGTSSSSAWSTASRPRSRPTFSRPGPDWWSISPPTFRVQDPALYQRYYGAHPARRSWSAASATAWPTSPAPSWPGRPPSRHRAAFATAAQLALYPLARAGLDVTPSLFAVTGSSGAGGQPKPTTHHPARAHNLFAYSVLGHRHEAEVLQGWREWVGRPDAVRRGS